jgi:hypothetical protein
VTGGGVATYESRTVGVAVARPPGDVYAFAAVPENLPRWASGLGTDGERDGDDWVSRMDVGQVRIRFAPRNDFGVLDHTVTLPDGTTVTNPMRVVANGGGSELSFTLFRLPGMTAEAFRADAATVQGDLQTLKRLLEASPAAPPVRRS